MISDGATTFAYDAENRLVSAAGAKNATLAYDPLGRLWQVTAGSATARFLYDGDRALIEYDGAGSLLRSYVHGPGADEPLVWYEVAPGGVSRRFLHADERGSIAAIADQGGNAIGLNRYDEYGVPAASNLGRFQYTGQKWIGELGLYDYKTRFYRPGDGRFMQFDTIGYGGGPNGYVYIGGDPVNGTDPTGTESPCITLNTPCLQPDANPFGDLIDLAFGDLIRAFRHPSGVNVALAAISVAPIGKVASWSERVTVRLIGRIGARSAVLSRRNFSAAAREARGETLATRADGTAFDHLNKIKEQAQGLRNDLRQSEAVLASGKLAPEDAARLREAVAEGQRRLNEAEAAIRRVEQETER